MSTNIKENGFETQIIDWMIGRNGYEQGDNASYNVTYVIDEDRLFRFLKTTQLKVLA